MKNNLFVMGGFMKTSILIIALSALLLMISSCDKPVPEKEPVKETDSLQNITRLQKFLSKKGELYVKEFYEVGKVSSNTNLTASLKITAVILYKPGEEEKRIKGLKIDITQKKYSGYSSYDDDETVFLDLEELKGLVDAIQYMVDIIKKWETVDKEYAEVIYSTTGNFKIGFLIEGNTKNLDELYGFVQAGFSKVSCYFNPAVAEQLNLVKYKINEGITLLSSK